MNRYEITQYMLRSLALNHFDCEQLAAVKDSVLRLVAGGTPTVELVACSMDMHHSKFRRWFNCSPLQYIETTPAGTTPYPVAQNDTPSLFFVPRQR